MFFVLKTLFATVVISLIIIIVGRLFSKKKNGMSSISLINSDAMTIDNDDSECMPLRRVDKDQFIQVSVGELKQYKGCIPAEIFATILLSKNDDELISIEKSEFDKIVSDFKRCQDVEVGLFLTTKNNNDGTSLEKKGEIDKAIQVYEKNLEIGCIATYSYDRLMVLYHKRKDYQNEIRVIKRYLELFSFENEKRYKAAIENNPKFKNEIQYAYIHEERVMGDNGIYIYTPYQLERYKEKLKMIMNKTY